MIGSILYLLIMVIWVVFLIFDFIATRKLNATYQEYTNDIKAQNNELKNMNNHICVQNNLISKQNIMLSKRFKKILESEDEE